MKSRIGVDLIAISMVIISASTSVNAQLYEVESFQDTYEELQQYSSVGIETKGWLFWDKEFELDFEFPFYDSTYTRLICDHFSICSLSDTQDFSLSLFEFDYLFDIILDTVNLQSDVRYALLDKNEMRALAIQFTKNRIASDPSIEEFDSYVNFQTWLFEDGAIEIRFGDMNLDNSPCYVPGEGFYYIPDNNPPVLLGPVVGIENPLNTTEAIGFEGAYNDYELLDHKYGYLTVLPPEGWVIRFRRNPDATRNINAQSVRIYPNPAQTEVTIDSEQIFERMEVFDARGRYFKSVQGANQMDISDLSPGMYVVKAFSVGEMLTGRFIKL